MNKSHELLNVITASIGMILSLIGFIFLVILSSKFGTYWHMIWCSIYGITLILLHTSSTLYHSTVSPSLKNKFLLMDRSCIYLLIAGTYTPVALINLYSTFGFLIFSAIWSLALLGIYLKIKDIKPFPNFEVFLCLFMGWFALIGIKQLVNTMDMNGIILIVLGGFFFTVGVFFLMWKNSRYGHAIWHLFVLGGCICHYLTIIFYVIPYKIINN